MQAVQELVKAITDGKTQPADNPAIVISPFCPEEKIRLYTEGLEKLGDALESTKPEIEQSGTTRGKFVGCHLTLRNARNPMDVAVWPLCVLQTDNGWKVAVGLSHFDNTHFGYDAALAKVAQAVAEETMFKAKALEKNMLDDSANQLLQDLQKRRATWPANHKPEDVIDQFLEYDRTDDAIGKLACYYLPESLTPQILEHLLSMLAEASLLENEESEKGDAHGLLPAGENREEKATTKPTSKPIFPFHSEIQRHEVNGQLCLVMGFLHPDTPSNFFSVPYYVRKAKDGKWAIIPEESEMEGLARPKKELVRWYEKNEESIDKAMIVQFSEIGEKKSLSERQKGQPHASLETKSEAHEIIRYHAQALIRRALPEALGTLHIPAPEAVEDYLGLMNGVESWCARVAPFGAMEPYQIELEFKQQGDFAACLTAYYQPAAKQSFILDLQVAHRNAKGWKVLPPATDGLDGGLRQNKDAQALIREMEQHWEEKKAQAVLNFFAKSSASKSPTSQDDKQVMREICHQAFQNAVSGKFLEFLAYWEKPSPGQDAVAALDMTNKLAWQIYESAKVPEIQEIHVEKTLAGVVLPLTQILNPDHGQKPARMILFRRSENTWHLLPGLEFYRPINRGFNELNVKNARMMVDRFDLSLQPELQSLKTWIENYDPSH